ncbi:hypothetical protein QYM36_002905 [Artemia franciscana]|nr:hypothetical protein QYM36_002905 [Artemia franciscana]
MHFSQSVAIIQSKVGTIKEVQALYNANNPLSADLVVALPQDGIRLVFDSISQRLKIIEVYDVKKVKLKYLGNTFNAPEVPPTVHVIDQVFGATHPGVYDVQKQLFTLNFRGLSLSFPVDLKCQPRYVHGLGSLQFPPGTLPTLSQMFVYSGTNLTEVKAPSLPVSLYAGMVFLDNLIVIREGNRTLGVQLSLMCEGIQRLFQLKKVDRTAKIMFGTSPQDVVTEIGAPSRIFYKSDDKMRIHRPNAHRRTLTTQSDYFFNYFTLGIDLLFDSKTHRLKKILLHTNFPGHYDFNMYHRCNFTLSLPFGEELSTGLLSSGQQLAGNLTITAVTKWNEIADKLKPSDKPIILNRVSTPNATNPFGSTYCFGYQDIIFEVTSNGHLGSVTFYANDEIL